jgi:hypothetical protein
MPYNANNELEEAMKEFGGSSGGSGIFYKVQEGNNNVVRILTDGKTYGSVHMNAGEYRTMYGKAKGDPLRSKDDWDYSKEGRLAYPIKVGDDGEERETRPSFRTVYYIIDRVDGKIKQAEFPASVVKQIGALQENPDYQFEEMPMPFDIRITYNKKNTPATMYKVDVKPTSAAPTKDQLDNLAEKMQKYSPDKVVEQKKQRQIEDDERRGMRISPEDLKAAEDEFNTNMKVQAVKQATESNIPTIEYPTEEINAEDIPF